MKSVTEFWNVHLQKGLKAKTELTAAGKTPEEIQTAIGETMKYEGDKLSQFMHAMEVASQNTEGLSRVLVVTLNEGETAPPKAVKLGETHHFIPEFQSAPKGVANVKSMQKGQGGGKGGKKGPKESPWGLSPEQKAAKKGGGAAKEAAAAPEKKA